MNSFQPGATIRAVMRNPDEVANCDDLFWASVCREMQRMGYDPMASFDRASLILPVSVQRELPSKIPPWVRFTDQTNLAVLVNPRGSLRAQFLILEK